jgi:hypothetical protein
LSIYHYTVCNENTLCLILFHKCEQNKYKRDLYFVPSIEPTETKDAFLTDLPHAMLSRGEISDVPLMTGLMTHEGMLQLASKFTQNPLKNY